MAITCTDCMRVVGAEVVRLLHALPLRQQEHEMKLKLGGDSGPSASLQLRRYHIMHPVVQSGRSMLRGWPTLP